MKRLKTHAKFLMALKHADDGQLQRLLYHSNHRQQKVIAEILHNTVRGNLPLSTEDKLALYPHRKRIKTYTNPALSDKSRQKLTRYQRGGWLGRVVRRVLGRVAKKALPAAQKKAAMIAKNKGLQKALKKVATKTQTLAKQALRDKIDDLSAVTSDGINEGAQPPPALVGEIEHLYRQLDDLRRQELEIRRNHAP